MQNIRSTDTLPEWKIMRELRRRKIYFAKNVNNIIGKPDIVFRRKKTVVFIDSDFWHGHPTRGVLPKSNQEYWTKKIARNKKRDLIVTRNLKHNGWKVIRLWEYDINHKFDKCIKTILDAIAYFVKAYE